LSARLSAASAASPGESLDELSVSGASGEIGAQTTAIPTIRRTGNINHAIPLNFMSKSPERVRTRTCARISVEISCSCEIRMAGCIDDADRARVIHVQHAEVVDASVPFNSDPWNGSSGCTISGNGAYNGTDIAHAASDYGKSH
jgi:hypothetical protein